MTEHFQPPQMPPPAPLKVVSAERMELEVDGQGGWTTNALALTFSRGITDDEVKAYEQLPPTPQMFHDVRAYAERLVLCELIVRLFRFYILGNIVVQDTPLIMDWLKSYLDGVGHGPIGQPLRWPRMCPSACKLMSEWGFEPTPTEPPYVAKKPKVAKG